jgi:hypothetical protein
VELFIDESGNTGSDYLSEDQPFFVIGIHWMGNEDITILKKNVFPHYRGDELKFKNIKRRNDKRKMLGVISFLEERKDRFCAYIVHKKSALIEKFVHDCIEPVFWRDGIDLSEKGGILAYTNMLNVLLYSEMGEQWYNTFLSKCNTFIRTKDNKTLSNLKTHCASAQKNSKDMLLPFIAYPALALSEIDTDSYRPDVYQALIIGLLVHIRKYFGVDSFNIVYDQIYSVKEHDLKELVVQLEKFKNEVTISRICSILPGIKIEGVNHVDSKKVELIQLADLIAGLTNYSLSPKNHNSEVSMAFRDMLDDRNLIHKICSTAVTPKELGTEMSSGLIGHFLSMHGIKPN